MVDLAMTAVTQAIELLPTLQAVATKRRDLSVLFKRTKEIGANFERYCGWKPFPEFHKDIVPRIHKDFNSMEKDIQHLTKRLKNNKCL